MKKSALRRNRYAPADSDTTTFGINRKNYRDYPRIAGTGVETTGFTRLPIPSIDVSITSPAKIWDVPAGVPVKMTSPGSSVMIEETYAMIDETGKIMSRVDAI